MLASSALPAAKQCSGTRMPRSGVKRSSWLDSSISIASISCSRRMNRDAVSPVMRATSFNWLRRRSAGDGRAQRIGAVAEAAQPIAVHQGLQQVGEAALGNARGAADLAGRGRPLARDLLQDVDGARGGFDGAGHGSDLFQEWDALHMREA